MAGSGAIVKLALVGHRGVGKSHLLKRVENYLSDIPDIAFLSLDQEIERRTGKRIVDIFSTQGEAFFRSLENKVFTELSSEFKNLVLDVGAGFEGSFPEDFKTLWVKRAIDSSQSQFLNRPQLDGSLVMDTERFLKREKRYKSLCDVELELLEHTQSSCASEKKYFRYLFGIEKLSKEKSSWFVTLFESHKNFEFLNSLSGCGFELRDDLLTQESIKKILRKSFPFIISHRNKEYISETQKLIKENILWDWPLEWGKSEAPIHSLHQRKDSLVETLKVLDSIDGVIKLAIPILDFKELQTAYQWYKEDPEKRVFLPSSEEGRWKWFRLLTGHQMKFSYLRESCGSSLDQPTLLEVLRYEPNNKLWSGILGAPVKHSLTPSTHEKYFKEKKANVLHVDLKEHEWESGISFLKELGLRWAAVTSPLKLKAFSLVKENQGKKEDLKSTNTLIFKDRWLGTNTDIDGLAKLALNLKDQSVVVWGGGGTLDVIKKFFPQAVFYSSRTGEPRGSSVNGSPHSIIWAVGRESFLKEGVLPPKKWSPEQVVDLNYTQDSPGISCAYNYGCQYHSGLDMFLEQARKQQEFWDSYGI